MSTPGSRATATGLALMLISVSAGMHLGSVGGLGLLLCFVGVLVGANHVAAGVRLAGGPAPVVTDVFASAQALAQFVRRNTTVVGLVMTSCAVTMLVSGEAHSVLCFAMIALLLLGVSLINIGARG